jgi:hypothetical protein
MARNRWFGEASDEELLTRRNVALDVDLAELPRSILGAARSRGDRRRNKQSLVP